MRASLEIPPGVDLDTAVEAIGLLLDRHRTLRTRFYVDENGTPRQAVSGAGELRVEVHETDGRHLPEFTRQVSQALLATPFTPPEISIRAALVAEEGRLGESFLPCFTWPSTPGVSSDSCRTLRWYFARWPPETSRRPPNR
ncbi:hypothetical protein AB0D40_37015 [Streptomyces massasporeus]|uniref:hypothetical protein n=1 Tax=Streptomyces massasporeus TaxID=67324 RepID=UPI0033ECBC81